MNQDIPEGEVFDQEEFVKKRSAKIKTIKQNSKNLNMLATEIHDKVEEQDEKIDTINRELGNNVDMVKGGNEDLEKASLMAKNNNKCIMKVLIIVIIAVMILAVLIAIPLLM